MPCPVMSSTEFYPKIFWLRSFQRKYFHLVMNFLKSNRSTIQRNSKYTQFVGNWKLWIFYSHPLFQIPVSVCKQSINIFISYQTAKQIPVKTMVFSFSSIFIYWIIFWKLFRLKRVVCANWMMETNSPIFKCALRKITFAFFWLKIFSGKLLDYLHTVDIFICHKVFEWNAIRSYLLAIKFTAIECELHSNILTVCSLSQKKA